MRRIEAKDWNQDIEAYLWVEIGDGELRRVNSIDDRWWIHTGYASWCCGPNTILLVPEQPEGAERVKEVAEAQRQRRQELRPHRRDPYLSHFH